jgi:hypothetical protein
MATTNRAVLRQRLSEEIGDYQALTTSANGTVGGTTVVDSSLRNLDGGRDDDAFEGWYILITSGDSSGESRRIHMSRVNTNTLTVQEAFTNQIAASVTYELHRTDPVDKHNALNRALVELSRQVPLPIRDETLVVDNLLANHDFETFSGGAFTNWSSTGTPTIVQETSRVMHGSQAARVTATGATEGLQQSLTINRDTVTNKQVIFGCWVYATVADAVRIRILWGSSSYESHAYHSGDDQWEFQDIAVTVPSTATEITAILEVTSGNVGIFDQASFSAGPVYRYTIPSTIIRGPHYLSQQADLYNPDGPFHPIIRGTTPTEGRILRLEGTGILSQPTTDAGTTEIGDPHVAIVIAYALMFLNRIWLSRSAQQQRERFDADMQMWGQEASSLMLELRRPRMGAMRSDHTWHIEEDASGRYLVFDVGRA